MYNNVQVQLGERGKYITTCNIMLNKCDVCINSVLTAVRSKSPKEVIILLSTHAHVLYVTSRPYPVMFKYREVQHRTICEFYIERDEREYL